MIKRLTKGAVAALIAVTLLLPFCTIKAGIPVGTWKAHPAYNNATKAVKAFGEIYVLSDGGIYSYNPEYDELYTIDKVTGLSDTDISCIEYCKTQNALLLVYSNGNIDILYDDYTIYNVTDLKNNNLGSVTVNELKITGDYAYLSTNIGLVIFDIKRCEIKNTYRFDTPVNTSVIYNDTLYCATYNGVFKGDISDNLMDKTNWKLFSDKVFRKLFIFDNQLSGLTNIGIVYTIKESDASLTHVLSFVDELSLTADNRLALVQDTFLTFYTSYKNLKSYPLHSHIYDVVTDGDDIWLCQGVDGLCRYEIDESGITVKDTHLKPNSPRRNWFHSVSWPQQTTMLAVGGYHNYNNIDYEGTLMLYENGRWSYFEDNLKNKTGLKYINLTEAVQDPNDPNHYFVGSAGQGLYEFRNLKFQHLYTWDNSPLQSILTVDKYNYVRISALQYDKNGNLWMINNEVDSMIKVLKSNGEWESLYYSEIAGLPTLKQMRFDHNGYIWLNSSRHKPGIICIDTKSTIKDLSDDIIRFSGSFFKNQDGQTEEVYDIYCYDFDKDNNMWIGTNTGIFVLKNTDKFLTDPNPIFERIKIDRNDDSGLADYLFSGVMITALYIDQGDRKWIGTLDDGVFLMSADGTETLEHFTTKNSPLPSDYILSISENGQNGSVFFGTSLGLVEYGGQARDAQETLSESNILVYPNPVKPDFDGYVTITGLTSESTIRIVSNSGKLVNYGTSNGGSYSWNLNDVNGNPVPSGVYHAIITTSDNNRSESTSITVIR